MPAPTTASLAVAALLTFRAQLDLGHQLESLANWFLAFDAQAEELRIRVEARKRAVEPNQPRRTLVIALGRDDLVHLRQGLRILVHLEHRAVAVKRLDCDITFGKQSLAFSKKKRPETGELTVLHAPSSMHPRSFIVKG